MLTLEEVREQLEQKGAFDRFKKKKRDDECEMETKISMLKQAMKNREENTEPFLEIEPCNHILSDVEAKDLSMFFTKKEIDDLVMKKYPAIKINLTKIKQLIKISETGNIPKKPLRVLSCMKCGMSKEFAIDVRTFWDMQEMKYYCENCKKEIDALNKPKTQQTGLI
jgi:hypothetical protein